MDETTMDETRRRGADRKGRAALVLALTVALTASAFGQNNAPAPVVPPRAKRRVIVSIPDRKLAVLENGVVIRRFAVAVGAVVSPSPTGEFEIINRLAEPTYYHPGVVIPPGSGNPLGSRWVGLNKQSYGIHGTNAPGSIGKAASHGCIRLRNPDIVQLFTMVRVGDTVEIRGERDEQIARIFGGEVSAPVAVAQARSLAAVGGGQ